MDQQTRQALKKDKFVSTTTHGLEWASENRQSVIATGLVVLGVVAVLVAGIIIYNTRSDAASVAFGSAMQVYQSQIAPADMPATQGGKTYPSIAERSKAANAQFVAVANKYGMTPSGKNALYFAGLTEIELGQNQQAEDALNKVASSWGDSNLAALAKLALAGLYRDTNRDSQAIDVYNQLAAKPTTTVPYGTAELQLADLYNTEGKSDEAKKIYALLEDKDAKGEAGAIAKQKLNPAPAAGPGALEQ